MNIRHRHDLDAAYAENETRNAAFPAETIRLFGWGDFADHSGTIRAVLFGEMVKRAATVTTHYLSDLFHDAEWITENVNGPADFSYLVREWGTNIGESAEIQYYSVGGSETRTLYRIALTENNGEWSATFTTIAVVQPAAAVVT